MDARRKSRLATVPAAAGVVLMALAAVVPLSAGTFSYTGSFQLAQGSYFFDQTTRGIYFFNGFSFNSETFTLTANIPLIYQSTPYVSYSGIGILPSGGSESSLVDSHSGRRPGGSPITFPQPETLEYSRFGMGDPLARLGIRLWKEGRVLPSVELTGQVKLPLAGVESGFGTGTWDYGAGLSVTKRLGRVFLFADVSYWALGDLPDLEIIDPWSFALSLGLPLAKGKAALLFSYFGLTRIIEGVEPPSAAGLGLSFKVGPKSSLMLNGSVGLSESSPDFTASFGWSLGF
jgi:hypothetical protein